jgi:hypothetical protein
MNSAFLDKELSRGGTFGLYNRTDNKKIESYVVTNSQSPEKEMSWEEMRRKEVIIEILGIIIIRKKRPLKSCRKPWLTLSRKIGTENSASSLLQARTDT